jgi:hypothetical protein
MLTDRNEDPFWQLIEDSGPTGPGPDAEQLAVQSSPPAVPHSTASFRAFVPYATNHVWAQSLLCTPDRAYKRVTGEEWDRNTRCSCESYPNIAGWAG